MRSISKHLLNIVLWILFMVLLIVVWTFLVLAFNQSATGQTLPVILESNPPNTCDVYNNVKVGSSIKHVSAALGKDIPVVKIDVKKPYNHVTVDKWITIYTYKEVVWRVEYNGLRLQCRYVYDDISKTYRYLNTDESIRVIYDPITNSSYVTNLEIWHHQIFLSN